MSKGSFPQAGFYYQNNVAALKILGLLDINSELITVELENYSKGPHIDDIIITKKDSIDFNQVKWSDDTDNSFTIYNIAYSLPGDSEKTLWKKLAEGYSKKITAGLPATIILYSPKQASGSKLSIKGINKSLIELIAFQRKYKQSGLTELSAAEKYDEFKGILAHLEKESGLSAAQFEDFFKMLHFQLSAPDLEHVKLQLETKAGQFGLEETQILKLLDLVVNFSITGETITKDILLAGLGIRDRFVDRLSQVFKIDEPGYVENTVLFQQLDDLLAKINNGFVFVEGVPGAGKSTALTKYATQKKQIRFSYYCFIPDDTTTSDARMRGEYFLKSLCVAIEKGFPEIDLPVRYSDNYADKLSQYFETLSKIGEKIIFLIDGLDHVDRNRDFLTNPLTNNLLSSLPDNLIIIITSQYIDALPPMIRAQILGEPSRHLILSRFSENQVRNYLAKKNIVLQDEEFALLMVKSEGIPLYLHYITSLLDNTDATQYGSVINEFPLLVDSKINTYHQLLFSKIRSDNVAKWVLALLANRKEYTSIEVLKNILNIAGVSYDTLQVSQILQSYRHLLKEKDALYYTIYHNSFREFILTNTEEIRKELNVALVKYYEQDVYQEDAYRNYFSHLLYLKEYDKILNTINDNWINESWRRYKSMSEIVDNINIAWNAASQKESISEFVRVGFLKHQLDAAGFNLDNSNFVDSTYFLSAGLAAESLKTIWDGEYPVISGVEFFNYYVIEYMEKTGSVLPLSIAKPFFSNFIAKATLPVDPHNHGREDDYDFGSYFQARSLYLQPAELFDELRSLSTHIDLDDIKSLAQFLRIHNKLAHLIELWYPLKEGDVKNFVLSELLLGLYRKGSTEISKYEKEFNFDKLNEEEQVTFLLELINYLPLETFLERYGKTLITPFCESEIIGDNYLYQVLPGFLKLLESLKIYYLLDEKNYTSFELKISLLPAYPRRLYFAISAAAKIWTDKKRAVAPVLVIDACKKIVEDMTIPQYLASEIMAEHGAKSMIQFNIHRIYKVIFYCLNEVCTDTELKDIIQLWISRHTENGFPDHRSDLAFADAVMARNELKAEVYSLIQHAEILARADHGTSSLVENLKDVGISFGKADHRVDYDRVYNELLPIACGVSYRKDYQFANIFSVLEKAHSGEPARTLQRLADNYYLLYKLHDAGNARMFHICMANLISFTFKHYPQLAFELLNKNDIYLNRDEALEIILDDIIPVCQDSDIPYLWAIITTLNKWENFGSDTYNNNLSLFKIFFKRLASYPDIEFTKSCYLYTYRQFVIEQNMPAKIIKINNELLSGTYSYDFIIEPIISPIKINRKVGQPRQKKEKTKIKKLEVEQLIEMVKRDFSRLEKYILKFKSHVNEAATVFTADHVIPGDQLVQLIEASAISDVPKWEELLSKYFSKPVVARSYLQLSKKQFPFNHDKSRLFLQTAFKKAESIYYDKSEWESELFEWAYISYPEKANYLLLNNFYAEFVDRSTELQYNLSKKIVPWQIHFNDPAFYQNYYQANYEYNIKLAEGLPEPDVDTAFIVKHKEVLDFPSITINYLLDLFDYPIVKIRHLVFNALVILFRQKGTAIIDYAIKDLKDRSVNQIEHILMLLHSVAFIDPGAVSTLVNKLGWIFNSGHYNLQEEYCDLIKHLGATGNNTDQALVDQASKINDKPFLPSAAIVRPLQHRSYFTVSHYQNEIVSKISDLSNGEINFSDDLYTTLVDSGYDITESRKEEAKVHRHYNINSNFDNLEINGPSYKKIQEKINQMFSKHIGYGFFENDDINKIKYRLRVSDPTDPFYERVSRPGYINWKAKKISEVDFLDFKDKAELFKKFLSRQEEYLTVFEYGYQRIGEYPAYYTQYFQVEVCLAKKNTPLKKVVNTLEKYHGSIFKTNLYRSELFSVFSEVDNNYAIADVIYPLVGASIKDFRGKQEDSIAIVLPHVLKTVGLAVIPGTLNFTDNKNELAIEHVEWQDEFKDHDRRRFEPLSQGCTLNIKKSILKDYASAGNLDIYMKLTLRRSTDKYMSESEMYWATETFIKRLDI